MECPQCRSVVPVAGNDPNSLPTVFFINGLIEVCEILKKAESNEIACQSCSEAKATSFCHTCSMFICANCTNAHKKMKVFESHKTIAISELREGALIQLPTKNSPTCKKHKGEMKLYCFQCEQLICRDCTLVDHAGHKFDFVGDVADAFRKEILSSLVPLRDTYASVTTAIANVEGTKKEIRDQGINIAATITQSFKELHAILNNHEQALLHQAWEVVGRKVGVLDRQQEDLQLTLATLDSLVGFVERTAESASDEEFISLKQQMTSRVQQVSRKYKEVKMSPDIEADLVLKVPPPTYLAELCTKSFLAYGPGLVSATTKEVSNFTIRTHDQPPTVQQNVSAELKSLVDGSVLQATVLSQTPSTYELSYTPTTRGRHQLTVRVNGTEIGTFQVFVQHPPTHLDTPVRTIKGVTPSRIAVGNQGDLFVTEHLESCYTILDAEGQRILTIKFAPFEYPTGIATDGEGKVYVANTSTDGAHKVRKFNRRGEVIKSVGKFGANVGEFAWPFGVRYHNNKVYVCDGGNVRVQVFDSNLNVLQAFGHGQLKQPRDIDFDTQGNMFILDSDKHQVFVFGEDGQYLHHLGQRGRGKGELSTPTGLCVSGDYVYITELFNRVSVFRTSGEFVHSFGKKEGSGRDELRAPFGIAIDSDGFVFVCDKDNSRIQVF